MLARFAQQLKGYPAIVYLVNRKWAAEKNHGQRFAKALKKAHEWLYDPKNKKEAIAILKKYTKRDQATLEKVYDLYFVTDKLYSPDGAVNVSHMKEAVELIAKNTNLPKAKIPSPDQYLLSKSDGALLK